MNNIKSYHLESEEKQKYYEVFVKIMIQLHKSKSEELFLSYINQTYQNQNCDKQITLIANFIAERNYLVLENVDRFIDLKWRLNTKVASRAVQNISNFEPKVTIEILKKNQKCLNHEKIFLHLTPSVLNHTIQKLEKAYIDSKNVTRK